MDNKLKESWDKITPDQETKKRMLNHAIKRAKHSKGNNRFVLKKLLPLVACLLIAGMATHNHFLEPSLPVRETRDTRMDSNELLKGLPVENFRLADADGATVMMDRIGFSHFGHFFEYGVNLLVLASVTTTNQWEASSATLQQTSTLQVVETIWTTIDEPPASISVNQSLYGGCLGDEKNNMLRENGLYVLPLTEYNGDWYVMGDLDVLFEIDDQGKVWSHSAFESFNAFDGENLETFLTELQNKLSSENFMAAHSPFGSVLREWTLADITIDTKSDKLIDDNGDFYLNYTFSLNRIMSSPQANPHEKSIEVIDTITVRAHELAELQLIPGNRYLLFLDQYEGEILANPRMIAEIVDNETIVAVEATDNDGLLGASVFLPYKGQTLTEIENLVSRIESYWETQK